MSMRWLKSFFGGAFVIVGCLCTFTFVGVCTGADSHKSKAYREDKAMPEQTNPNIGKRFPQVTAASLAKTKESIPDSCKGKVTLVTVAFLRESQSQLDSWLNPFAEKFGKQEGFMFYEVPMISSGYVFMKPIIDGGMRAGLPQFKHRHVVTMYGDVEKYSKELNINPRMGHAFLLDKEGIIRWQGEGFATAETMAELIATAEALAK